MENMKRWGLDFSKKKKKNELNKLDRNVYYSIKDFFCQKIPCQILKNCEKVEYERYRIYVKYFIKSMITIYLHCVKSVQIRSFFLFRICLYSVRMRINTDQKKLRIWTLFTYVTDGNSPFLRFTVLAITHISEISGEGQKIKN